MRKRHRSSITIMLLAILLLVLGGTGYAASRAMSSSHEQKPSGIASRKNVMTLGAIRAYALVSPTCDTCLPPLHYTPLDALHSMNVVLGSSLPGAPSGTWCFILDRGVNSSNTTVVASVEGGTTTQSPGTHPTSLTSAQWVVGAPDCSRNQIEVQTLRYTVDGTSLIATHGHDIAFSFMVVQR